MKKIAVFVGMLGIMLTVGLFGCSLSSNLDYVTIDINPSVDMVVDRNEKVQTVTALNADAEVLLENLQLQNMNLEEAVDEIIDEAIDLGFIDPNSEGTTVTVDGSSEQIRNRLHEHVNNAFKNKGVIGSAMQNPNTELLEEAETLGVTPGFLRLVNRALEADDELTKEDALLLSQQELIKIIKNKDAEMKMVQNELKAEFFTERQAIFDQYLPQIQALEAEIEELETLGESTEAKLAELEAIKTEFHDALAALRAEYQAEGQAIREQIQIRKQDRIQANQQTVEAFRSQMNTRRQERRQAIESYQNQFQEHDDEEVTTSTEEMTTATQSQQQSGSGNN